MYGNYSFYTDTYNGRLTEEEYNRFCVRASAEIDRMTLQKAKNATGEEMELVKFAECAVIDELSFQSVGGSGDVTSESNDGISRSYATGAVSKSSRQRIDAAAYTFLCNTNLLFCGI
jgi:hypothetical protein